MDSFKNTYVGFFYLDSIDQLTFPLHAALHWKKVFIIKPAICTLYIDFFLI